MYQMDPLDRHFRPGFPDSTLNLKQVRYFSFFEIPSEYRKYDVLERDAMQRQGFISS